MYTNWLEVSQSAGQGSAQQSAYLRTKEHNETATKQGKVHLIKTVLMSDKIRLTAEPEASSIREQRGHGEAQLLMALQRSEVRMKLQQSGMLAQGKAGMCRQRLTSGLGREENYGSLFPWKLQSEYACRRLSGDSLSGAVYLG